MMSPFDWQEALGQRAEFIQGRLSVGLPIAAVSCADGILIATHRIHAHKIFEIYDELAFAAIGLQSDVEGMRVAAVEFAHREGFQRSEKDVSIQRVVQTLSQPMKRAFNDFRSAPVVVKCVLAELGDGAPCDEYYVLDYDGDYHSMNCGAIVAGSDEAETDLREYLASEKWSEMTHDKAMPLWREKLEANCPKEVDPARLTFDAALVERVGRRERRFRSVTPV